MKLYHGTLKRYLPTIREHGLEPTHGVVANTQGVFLAPSIEGAEYWAQIHWGCFYDKEGNKDECDVVVLGVDIPEEQADKWLKPDVEQWDDYGDIELSFEEFSELDYDIRDEDSLDNLINRLQNGKVVCPAWRHYCKIDGGSRLEGLVLGHEGRHRALASKEVALERFPIVMLRESNTSCETWADEIDGNPAEYDLSMSEGEKQRLLNDKTIIGDIAREIL